MTFQVEAQQDAPTSTTCWCCGKPYPEDELVHLGQHPEVGVCLGCARWLQRRAMRRADERHRTAGAHVRATLRRAREVVISRGWHDRPVVGPLLRRIDRRLP